MTHVFVDARSITAEPSGVARYAANLLPEMIALRPWWDWTILRHASNRRPIDGAEEVFVRQSIGGLESLLWGQRAWATALGSRTPDIVHSLFHLLPTGRLPASRTVVTAHDFIWIDHAGLVHESAVGAWGQAWFGRRAIPYALRRADHVIAGSGATAERARRWIPAERVTVVEHGLEPVFREPPPAADGAIERLRRNGGRYVVAVGNDKPYKNLVAPLEALARLRHPRPVTLVLVGRCDGLAVRIDELGLADRVVRTGFLSDEELRRVVGNADAFVFPSLVEGFGFPPLEAMALGTPTIVSDVEPMRSLVGEASLRFEPDDPASLARLLGQVLSDAELARRLGRLGRERVAGLDWKRAAEETLAVYGR